jgi:glycosyltransferase involved in cell wall biosynthesis
MIKQVDIVLSVWNRFFAREQIRGFLDGGLSVFALGTTLGSNGAMDSRKCVGSMALLYILFKTKSSLFHEWSMDAYNIESSILMPEGELLWALGGMNLRCLEKATRWQMPSVLDVASAHKRMQREVLATEYKACGVDFPTGFYDRWAERSESEYNIADFISVGSKFVKRSLVERGVEERKIIVNPYGVNATLWKEAHTQSRRLGEKLIFVYVAGLTLRKGPQYLVRAWKRAQLRMAELWVVGGGKLPWDKLAGSLPEGVKLLGGLPHQEIKEIYKRAHVYVLPSLIEGLARSGLEAMAAGLPLIITEETGLTDFVNNGQEGWVVPSRNEEALVEIMRWCSENREQVKSAGERAFVKGQQQDFESYGDRCANIAKAVIDGRSPMPYSTDQQPARSS